MPGSTVVIESRLGDDIAQLSDTSVIDNNTIITTLAAPVGAVGTVDLQVQSPINAFAPSQPVTLTITPSGDNTSASLPTFEVADYGASGSGATYSCSGVAGSTSLECSGEDTDFEPGEGIRIVGASDTPSMPPIAGGPILTMQGKANGNHTYCYIVFTADALGGISHGSLPACVSEEPASLSLSGNYSLISDSYHYPLAAQLLYRSLDDGPYQLIAVNGSMDVGQSVRTHGGWPEQLSSDTSDLFKRQDLFATVVAAKGNMLTLDTPLHTAVDGALVDHDDTNAFQAAINAAVSSGGGIIHIGSGTFNIRRPAWQDRTLAYTTEYAHAAVWSRWWFLYVPNYAPGHIHFLGNGSSSIIQLPPEYGSYAVFLGVGNYGHPAYSPYRAIPIEGVDKGATRIQLVNTADAVTISPGTDVWLYSGSFNSSACVNSLGTAGGNCHFSELNSIAAVSGRTLQLAYPTSKRYYDDGVNSFGLVVLPTSPHDISIENLTLNSSNRLLYGGVIYGLTINNININGITGYGVFGGGLRRDMLIENSSWQFGAGDASWGGTDEFDQDVDLAFVHNHISGLSTPGAEGPSLAARLYLTEGTSQVSIVNNIFDHVSIYAQDTTDDVIEGNTFVDGIVALGDGYVPEQYPGNETYLRHVSFLSFGSSESASVTGNTFSTDAEFKPPWIISLGHFQNGEISGNTINTEGPLYSAAIASMGGQISNNKLQIQYPSKNYVGIRIIPDEGPDIPFSSFNVVGNSIIGKPLQAGIGVTGLSFPDEAPICLRENDIKLESTPSVYVWNADHVVQSCDQ